LLVCKKGHITSDEDLALMTRIIDQELNMVKEKGASRLSVISEGSDEEDETSIDLGNAPHCSGLKNLSSKQDLCNATCPSSYLYMEEGPQKKSHSFAARLI